MPDLGKAYVQIVPSAKGMGGNLKKELEGTGTESGGGFGAAFGAAAKKLIAAAAIGATIKKSLDAGGALQQSFGGLDTLYGDAAEAAKKYAYEASQAGISANTYAEQAVSFGASLKAAYGGDTQKAMEAANTAILDMADNAAKMGTPIENIQNAYQGFAKQNYTMLDNLKLGYGGTKKEMERLLADAEKLTGVKYDMDNLGDVYDAIHAIQDNLGLTGVAAAEASGTFTGSFAAMKASAENLLANFALGMDITEPLRSLLGNAKAFLMNNLVPMLGNIIKQIPTLLGELSSIGQELLGEIVNGIQNNAPQMIQAGVALIVQLVQGFSQNAALLVQGAITIFGALVDAVKKVDWKKVGSDILNAIKDGMKSISKSLFGDGTTLDDFLAGINAKLPDVLDKGIEIISNVASGIMSALPTLVSKAGEVILSFARALITAMPVVLEKGKELIKKLLSGITSGLPELGTKAGEIIGKFARYLMDNAPQILQKGIELVGELAAGIIKAIPKILECIVNLNKAALEQFKDVNWAEVGQDILAGIAEGLVALGDTLLNAVKEACDAIWNGFKDFFGIASPSKLMKTAGIDIIKGLINGLKDTLSLSNAVAAMSALGSKILSALDISGYLQKGKDIVGKVASGLKDSTALSGATAAAQAVMTTVGNAFSIGNDNPFYKAGTGVIGQLVSGLNSQSKALDGALNSIVAKFTSMANQAQAQANKANAAANSNNLSNNPIAARIGGSLSEESNNTSEIADLLYTFLPIIAQNGNMDGMYDALNRQFGWGIS